METLRPALPIDEGAIGDIVFLGDISLKPDLDTGNAVANATLAKFLAVAADIGPGEISRILNAHASGVADCSEVGVVLDETGAVLDPQLEGLDEEISVANGVSCAGIGIAPNLITAICKMAPAA